MKVVFTAAVMDLCHKGHMNLLREMRKEAGYGGKVIVILHSSKNIYETKGKIPIQTLEQRIDNLKITGLVDEARAVDSYDELGIAFESIIAFHSNDELIFMRGDDWLDFPKSEIIMKNNIEIQYIPYTKEISSSKIRSELEKL